MKQFNNLTILGIETSCDDTAVAVLEIARGKFKILSNIISSQVKLHKKYGGVYPMLAKREHQKNLPLVLKKMLKETSSFKKSKIQIPNAKQNPNSKFPSSAKATGGKQIPKLDLIAVTKGPGLEPCLWQGINFAKTLSYYWGIPVVPVNHIESHILVNFLNAKENSFGLKEGKILNTEYLFPAICLVVSGGHTELILMEGVGKYKLLGETRDDAAGECFDKTARILGLGYPGGPAIAEQARQWKSQSQNPKYEIDPKFLIKLPRPMIHQKNYDFSFSGLKTAVLYQYQKSKIKNQKYKQAMSWEIQQAIIDVLIHKTLKAAKDFKAKSIILGGGVTANDELRKQFKEAIKKQLPNTLYLMPKTSFCTDNAVMVGLTGYFRWIRNKKLKRPKTIEADANLKLK
jgi:N6-L-threonylcarbamoyladenine synthase